MSSSEFVQFIGSPICFSSEFLFVCHVILSCWLNFFSLFKRRHPCPKSIRDDAGYAIVKFADAICRSGAIVSKLLAKVPPLTLYQALHLAGLALIMGSKTHD
jgi:hypothetical protein